MIRAHHLRNKVHIAVLGGNGFIGRNVIRRLSNQENLRIWSIDKRYHDVEIDTDGYAAIVQQIPIALEASNEFTTFLAAQPVDVVIYCAGFESPTDGLGDIDNDIKSIQAVMNTLNSYVNMPLFEEDHVRPYFLYVSSWSVYGENSVDCSTERDVLVPANFTGMGKMYAEDVIQKVLGSLQVPWCILRPTEVYGRRHFKAGYLHYYIDKVVRRETEIEVFSPNTEIDLVHVNHMSKVIVDCIVEMRQGIYNVSSGKPIKILDLVKKVQSIYGEEYSKILPSNKLSIENMSIDSSKLNEIVPYDVDKYPIDSFIEQYLPVRRLEVARDMSIDQIINEPKVLDTTPFNAVSLLEKRKERRAIEYAAIKEVAGDQFKYIRYGRFQERAQELLGFDKRESELPPGEEGISAGQAISRVKEIFKLADSPAIQPTFSVNSVDKE